MICVAHNRYADELEEQLKDKGYRMTELASSGGFMKKGSTTFLFGIKDNDVEALRTEMQNICLELEKKKGKLKGGQSRYTSFVINVKDAMPILHAANK